MNKAERLEKKSRAALLLAGGASAPTVATAVGIGAEAVRKWRREPEFAAAVEQLREIARSRDLTAEQKVEAACRVGDRITGGSPPNVVTVSIPAWASPAQRRRLVARGVARVLDGSFRD